jgi:hypothetical protein
MQKMNGVRQEQSFINKQISEEDEEDLQYLAEAGVLRLASGERPAGKRRRSRVRGWARLPQRRHFRRRLPSPIRLKALRPGGTWNAAGGEAGIGRGSAGVRRRPAPAISRILVHGPFC